MHLISNATSPPFRFSKNKKKTAFTLSLIARRMAHESRLGKKYLRFPKTLNFHSNLL
nr:MAG TPA: hypothetical protein [Caudoviricetes sp.]